MSYTKEQTQTMALIAIVALVIVVGSYMGVIKPNLGHARDHADKTRKWADELTTQRRMVTKSLDIVRRAEGIEARTAELESQLRHGLLASRLTSCFEDLRRTHRFSFRFQNKLERIEPLNGGQYYELTNVFRILACDFYELVRFIHVLETTNPGVRVSDLEVRPHEAAAPNGLVDAMIEVRLIGYKDGQDEPWESASQDTFRPERRNPFMPPGMGQVDPNAPVRQKLASLCYNGTIGRGVLLRPSPEAAAQLVEVGKLLPFFNEKVRLVRQSSRALIVCHEPTNTHYRLRLYTSGERAGQVEEIEEIQ
jgi:hypothetical protein